MAKKEDLRSNAPPLDDYSDMDFDFDAPPPKDDRKPVTKVAYGAMAGARDTLKDKAFIRSTIKSVLPEGYGMAMDLQQEASAKARQLYNNAAREIKPSIASMTSAAEKLLPAGATKLKAKLGEINKWADEKPKTFSENSKEDQRSAFLAESIRDTFKFQMEQDAKSGARVESRERLQEGLAYIRHKDNFSLLNKINIGINRLSQYQDKVTSAYQRKSLELQYRTLYANLDSLEESRKFNKYSAETLASIAKNTGLPDYVKLTTSERIGEVMRNKLMDKVSDSLFGGRGNIVGKMGDQIERVLKEKISSFVTGMSMPTEIMEAAGQAKEMTGEGGADGYVMSGQAIGQMLMQQMSDKLGPKMTKYLPKSVLGKGEKIKGIVKNAPQLLDQYKNSGKGNFDTGIKGILARFAKELIPGMGIESGLEKDTIGSLNKPYIYTKQTHKSINEVIPGYLARIFRELQVIRTGDDKTPLTVFDNKSSKFVSKGQGNKNIFDSIVSKSGMESTKIQMTNLLKMIDPQEKMSPEARKAFMDKTLKDNVKGKYGGASRTASEYTYSSDEGTAKYAKEIALAMQQYFKSDRNGKIGNDEASQARQNAFTDKQRELGGYIADSRAAIQNLINLGNYDQLEEIGLVKTSNDGSVSVDTERLAQYYAGDTYSQADDPLSSSKKSKSSGLGGSMSKQTSGRSRARPANVQPKRTVQQPRQMGQQSNNSEFIKQIMESNKESSDKSVDHLGKIQELIVEGNIAQEAYFSALIDTVKLSGGGGGAAQAGETGAGNNGNIFQGASINLKNFLGKTTKTVGKVFSMGHKVGMHGIKTGFKVLGAATSLAKGALNTATSMVEKLVEKRSLYMPGEEEPRLSHALLKAGKYFDQKTKKVIKNLYDIKGTVVDENGEIVITKEELKTSYVRTKRGSAILKLGSTLFNFTKGAITNGFGMIPPIFRTGIEIAKSSLNFVKNLLDQPQDIYIAGLEFPVILARSMRGGGYRLKSDRTVVSRPSQITGAVMDQEGNIVITDEDLRRGLFDKNGQPIRSPLGKIINFGKNVLMAGVRAVGYAARSGLNVAKKGLSLASKATGIGARFIGGGLGSFGGGSAGSVGGDKAVSLLEQIYRVLDMRLPPLGNRKGSWKDMDRAGGRKATRAADAAAAKAKAEEAKKSGSSGGRSFLDRFIDNKTDGTNKPAGTPDATGKKKGFFSRLKGGKAGMIAGLLGAIGLDALLGSEEGSIGSTIGKVVDVGSTVATVGGLAGLGASTTVAASTAAAGAATATAATAGVAGTAVAGAGIGSTILAGLGGLGTAIAAIAGSPVVLGGLALAAVGTGLYYGYKYFNKKTTHLTKLRAAQYGFMPINPEGASKAFELEDMLKKDVYYEQGRANVNMKKFDYEKAFKLFSVDAKKGQEAQRWAEWFKTRFKPVFLTHLTALLAVDKKMQLADVAELKPEDKVRYLDMCRFKEGPYGYTTSPIPGDSVRMADASDVESVYQKAKEEIDAEGKDKENARTGKSAVEAISYDNMGNPISGGDSRDNKNANVDAVRNGKQISQDLSRDNATGSVRPKSVVTIAGAASAPVFTSKLDTLEGVRMRTYGLTTMESDKVQALRKLENLILKSVQYDGSGKAIYKGDSIDVLVAGGLYFGVSTESAQAKTWNTWYQTRFLPVFLTYAGLIRQLAGSPIKSGITPSLTGTQALSIATQISSIDGIWSIKDSPWANYSLGLDQAIVKELIESLRTIAKQEKIAEAAIVKEQPRGNNPSSFVATSSEVNDVNKQLQNRNRDPAQQGSSDAESKDLDKQGTAAPGANVPSGATSGLALAGGAVSDGRNASRYLQFVNGSTLTGLNPEMHKNLMALVDEYGTTTGKTTFINSGFRTYAQQLKEYIAKKGVGVAKPGSSMHEYGLAVDIPSRILNHMDSLGLLRKYGFTRPVANEPWHLEPAGIQMDINGLRQNQNAAAQAIAAGVGKGGGGYGTLTGITGHGRNGEVAKQVLEASVSAKSDTETKPIIPSIKGTDQSMKTQSNQMATYDGMGNVTGYSSDVESDPKTEPQTKTKSQIYGSAPNTRGGGAAVDTGNKMPGLREVTPSSGGKYDTMPVPKGAGWANNKDLILAAAAATGTDPKLMATIGAIESGFDPSVKARTSSASGLNQFIESTWQEQLKKNGAKYGIPANASPFDARANALLGGEYLKENIKSLSGVKQDITGTDAYLAHFLGAGGAKTFLSADPSAIGAQILPAAAKANYNIFYDGGRARTVSEIYSLMGSKVQNKLSQAGVDSSYFPSTNGLQTKNTTTTGLSVRTPTKGLSTTTAAASTGGYDFSTGSVDPMGGMSGVTASRPTPKIADVVNSKMDIGGFNMQSTPTTPQNTKQDMTTAMGDVGNTLIKSLNVQTQMLAALQMIVQMNGTINQSTPAKPQVQVVDTTVNSETNVSKQTAATPFKGAVNRMNVPVPMNRV
jgi:hypothetical protein